MFELDRFISECRAASRDGGQKAVRELVAGAVSDPAEVMRCLGEPQRAGFTTLHHSPELTVLNLVWGAGMCIPPHNHNIWAVIGIYTGAEHNMFWRRLPGDRTRIEGAGVKDLGEKDVATLGRDIIHSVRNPLSRLTGALHVYGGDFFAPGRSEWDEEHLSERPYDSEATKRLFEAANHRQ